MILRKQTIRSSYLQRLKNSDHYQSDQIQTNVIKIIEELNPNVLHVFIPMPHEIQTSNIIQFCWSNQIKTIVPKTLLHGQMDHLEFNPGSVLSRGRYGTQHPIPESSYSGTYDAILVPGIAFDRRGNRIGHGHGYYDRFLAQHPDSLKIGICYHWQLADDIPHEEHDITMNTIVTEKEIIHISGLYM